MTDYFSAATGLDRIGSPMEAQPVDYFSAATGLDKIGQQPQQQRQKQEGWGEWIKNSIKGRQDPNEANTKTVFEQFPKELGNATANAAIFGADDKAMGDIIQKNLGDKFIRREPDANGYDVMVTRGPDGQEQRGYVNRPGLDMQDVSRGVYGSLPYVAVGGAIGKLMQGAGVGLQAIGQGLGAGITSAAGDAATMAQGSEQGIDPVKAGVMTGIGMAGPVASSVGGALWRKFVTVPGLVDEATGQLTTKGLAAAQKAGIDPADIVPDFARSFAKNLAQTGNEAAAATQAGIDRFGIPATRGQISKDPYQLTQEEGMRRRLYGESAQDTMRAFDQKQQDAIKYAALGSDGSNNGSGAFAPKQGIAEQINPTRRPGAVDADRAPAVLGNNVQDTLQAARSEARRQEGALWDDNVKNLAATPQARENLRPQLSLALQDETAFTQTGEKMAKAIGEFADGGLPTTEAGGITLKPIQSVDQMRRHLGGLVGEAAPGSDKHQAGKIYDAFNDWIADSASKQLLDGDPAAAMQLIKARGFTKQVREVFQEGTKKTPAGQRMAKVLDDAKADSGEAVINALLGSQGSRSINDGTVSALSNIKQALDKFAPADQAAQAWNDIRLAHWTRLVTGKNGELLGPTAMVNNLKAMLQNQSSLARTLYKPLELRQMREFVRALEVVSYKPPNASGSGYTAAQFAKEWVVKLLDAFGLGKPANALLQYSGVGSALNSAAAKQAIRQVARPIRPNATPYITGAGQAVYNQSGGGR